ncbi:MAG: DUF87 domain-containing protein, partial [Kiritimatiellae bacterium]|nr:DUF87 domain-containing protein [Kiritimatiellia bacterium]
MTTLENQLLSLAKPGDTLRFAWHRAAEDIGFRFSMEGFSINEKQSRQLEERFQVFFKVLGENGIDFTPPEFNPKPDQESGRWMEIRPNVLTVNGNQSGGLGFQSGGPETPPYSKSMQLPALSSECAPPLVNYLLDYFQESGVIRRIYIEFSRMNLNPDWESILGDALNMRFSEVLDLLSGKVASIALQRFMALWWVRKSGWGIRCLVEVAPESTIPNSEMELFGREWFGTDCLVAPATNEPTRQEHFLDLSQCYPEGWDFPKLIPPVEVFEDLSIRNRLNARLPKLPGKGLLIGDADGKEVRFPLESATSHSYLLGGTGSGKSTLMARMIRSNLEAGESVVLLDPHGDLHREILDTFPKSRVKDLLNFDPTDSAPPPGLNILDIPDGSSKALHADFLISELLNFFVNLWPGNMEAFGPMFELYFRQTLLLMIHQNHAKLSLVDFEKVLVNPSFRKELLNACPDKRVVEFWTETALKVRDEASLSNIAPYITSKVSPLINGHLTGRLLGHPKNEWNLHDRLGNGGVVLASLNKGFLGHQGCRLIGTLLVTQLFAAGLQRSLQSADKRPP